MSGIKFLTIAQQVAQHLRNEIGRGRWSETLPGKPFLAKELDLNDKTVEVALRQLEREGLLESQGAGRPRRISAGSVGGKARQLRVGLLLWDAMDRTTDYLRELQSRLEAAGHLVVVAPKTLFDLKMNVARIARQVEQTKADAWVVSSGSEEVLGWFSRQEFPAFAVFGGVHNVPIAGVGSNKSTAMTAAVNALARMGHRRIVLLVRRQHRLPVPGATVKAFLSALEARGIGSSTFSLPDWEESAAGFQNCLASLFQVTPPTALIVDEPLLFATTLQFMTARGLRLPQDVSLIYHGHEAIYDWCVPTIARIETDLSGVGRHITRWCKNVVLGKADLQQNMLPAAYVPGDTVGPAPQGRVKLEDWKNERINDKS